MKFKLLLLFFLVSGIAYGQRSVYPYAGPCYIIVNGTTVISNSYLAPLINGWIGLIYVEDKDSSINDYGEEYSYFEFHLSCTIYMHPGDSVTVIDTPGLINQTFYAPDSITDAISQTVACGSEDASTYFMINIQYFPDSLEQQYQELKQAIYLINFQDSMQVVDSLKSLDSLATIQNIQSGKQNTIYPNPTTGLLNFTNYYPANGTAGVEIFDVNGREIIQQNFEVSPGLQTNPIDMDNLPNGVYLVQYTINGNRKMEKVVKM